MSKTAMKTDESGCTAADYLRGFGDVVAELFSAQCDELCQYRHIIKRDLKDASAAWDRGEALNENTPLHGFLGAALGLAEIESEFAELQELNYQSLSGNDDLMGNFDFGKKITRKWFERLWLSRYDNRQRWERGGFTFEDLKAIQTPEQRVAAGIKPPSFLPE